MVNQADAPLTKVSLNLFTEDVIWMQETFGPGWTGELRKAVRKWRREMKNEQG